MTHQIWLHMFSQQPNGELQVTFSRTQKECPSNSLTGWKLIWAWWISIKTEWGAVINLKFHHPASNLSYKELTGWWRFRHSNSLGSIRWDLPFRYWRPVLSTCTSILVILCAYLHPSICRWSFQLRSLLLTVETEPVSLRNFWWDDEFGGSDQVCMWKTVGHDVSSQWDN